MKELSLSQLQHMIDPGNLGQQLLAEIVRARKERDAALEQVKEYRRTMMTYLLYCLDKEQAIEEGRTLQPINIPSGGEEITFNASR